MLVYATSGDVVQASTFDITLLVFAGPEKAVSYIDFSLFLAMVIVKDQMSWFYEEFVLLYTLHCFILVLLFEYHT